LNPPDFRAAVRQRLPGLSASARPDDDIVEELAQQLEAAYESALADGLDEPRARQQIEAQLQQDHASWQRLDGFLDARVVPRTSPHPGAAASLIGRIACCIHALRRTLRHLARDASFTVPVIITLTGCIAVNAVVFTIVNTVILRPLPFPDPDRVVLLAAQGARSQPPNIRSDVPSYFDRREHLTVFEEMAMFRWIDVSVDTPTGPRRIRGDVGTPSLLRLLGVVPLHGRLFREGENPSGADREVILSYELWQEMYHGNPAIVGAEMRLDGRVFTIIGIMPEGFEIFRLDARLWIPAVYSAEQRADTQRGSFSQYQIGRLKSEVTLDQARRELATFDRSEAERFPALRVERQRLGFYTSVDRLHDVMTREVHPILQFLSVGAALVLLVGMVTTANLTISRARRYSREVAMKLALGARASHIVKPLIADGLVIGITSGLGGLVVGAALLSTLTRVGVTELPRAAGIHLDSASTLVTLAAALAVGLVIGLAPGVGAASADLSSRLRGDSRPQTSDRRSRVVRRLLVTVQVASALVLLAGTGLLLVSFWNLLAQKPGFSVDDVITASFDVPASRYPTVTDVRNFVDRALEEVRHVPGVATAGITQLLPFGGRTASLLVRPDGADANAPDVLAWNYVVSPGYLEAMQVPLLAGRLFDEDDTPDRPPVVIVDEALAQRLWPDGAAVGRQLIISPRLGITPRTVVGVVGAVRQSDLSGRNTGATYRPHSQLTERAYTIAIRSQTSASVLPAVRAAVETIDPHLPLYDESGMADRVRRTLAPRRLALTLAAIFGATTLLLAMTGIYGVLTDVTDARRREFGIRLALGCSVADLVWLVIREAALLTAIGAGLGLAAMTWLRDLLALQVYGVKPMDPLVLTGVVAVIALVVAVASLQPVRRVTRVTPATVLEHE
jgi:predicted permease